MDYLHRWIWGAKNQETRNVSLVSSESSTGFREAEKLKHAAATGPRARSDPRRIRRKLHSRETKRINKEYDVVVVPSDEEFTSGSDSDGLDWSIGWFEPHSHEFRDENEADNGFAVLVPSYGRGHHQDESSKKHALGAADGINQDYADVQKYIDQWLSENLSESNN